MKLAWMTASVLALLPASALGAPVKITVHGVASGKGNLHVSLCSKAEFLKRCAISQKVKAKRGDVVVTLPKVPAGNYGLSAFHDENGNGSLDRGEFGIPTEGYGFGRDAVGNSGPPEFEATVVRIPRSGGRAEITLRY